MTQSYVIIANPDMKVSMPSDDKPFDNTVVFALLSHTHVHIRQQRQSARLTNITSLMQLLPHPLLTHSGDHPATLFPIELGH